MLDKNNLLKINITNATQEEILEYILQSLKNPREKYYIVTPNPEILVYANKHPQFRDILNDARLGLPDGTGVIWAGKMLNKNFKERVTGTDLMENLCKGVCEKPITVGFLGAGPKIADKTAKCLQTKYPQLKISFIGQEWNKEGFVQAQSSKFKVQSSKSQLKSQNLEIKGEIRNTKYEIRNTIDILFVAFGFPKQEEWISKNLPNIPVKVAIGVGGAFDYASGIVPRAPIRVQNIGFEWLYRLIRQPWRFKRQLTLIEFIYLIIKERLIK